VVPVCFFCRYFGIARSTFYYWRKDKKLVSLESKKVIQDAIKKSFKDSKGTPVNPLNMDRLRGLTGRVCHAREIAMITPM
jgi:hypothetical protein